MAAELALAEQALRESEARFRAMFENAMTGMVVISTEGRLLQANPAFCALVGRSEEELLESTFLDVVHPDDHSLVLAAHESSLELRFVPA
jgi:PAS domain S-box-containing protein